MFQSSHNGLVSYQSSKHEALTIGIFMGLIIGAALVVLPLVQFGVVSMSFGRLILTALLVMVTAAYTLATFGPWVS